jgi:hypothetical protein
MLSVTGIVLFVATSTVVGARSTFKTSAVANHEGD